jgi:hypothetical protein
LFKLGRNRPDPTARRLRFVTYASPVLGPPPLRIDWQRHWSAQGLKNIYGNDELGDCTAVGAGHAIDIWRGAAGNQARLPTRADVIKFYSQTTGYVPGDPSTDQGGDEITVLNSWRHKGFFEDGTGKIAAWVTVDGSDEIQVKQAIWLGETVYFGVELPDAWIDPEPESNGFFWGVAGPPNPNNGHAFVAVGYNSAGVQIDTWGLIGTVTWAAVKFYTRGPGGQLYVMFSHDAIERANGKAPNGFDFATLLSDSASL